MNDLTFQALYDLLGTNHGSIHIFGSPGVDIRLEISDRARVKLLQFSSSTLKLLCVGMYVEPGSQAQRTYN